MICVAVRCKGSLPSIIIFLNALWAKLNYFQVGVVRRFEVLVVLNL